MNRIKHFFALIGLLLLPVMALAQESPAQRWIRTFDGQPGITSISISRTMFRMLSRIKSTDPEYQKVARFAAKLEDFKIMVIEEQTPALAKAVIQFNKLVHASAWNGYEELMSIREGGNEIAFRVQEQQGRIRELVMTITGSDHVVMLIKGDFALSELTDISDDINISGINKIKKLKK